MSNEFRLEWPEEKPTPKQVDHIDFAGKTWSVGDKVVYVPNHAFSLCPGDPLSHPDCERGVITSLRTGGHIWVRYEHQHITQPGQKTPAGNLRLI